MYINSGYLRNSRIDFKDHTRPLVVGSCGTYRLSGQPSVLPTHRPRGRVDYQLLYVAAGKAHYHLTPKQHVYHTGTRSEFRWIFQRMILELQLCKPLYEEMLASLLNDLLLLICRQQEQDRQPGSIQDEIIEAIAYLSEHYNQDISVSEYAKTRHISTNHFIRSLKQYTGMTPKQYIVSLRMTNAQMLLESSSYTIQEIADFVGYGDALYFGRLFKREMGMTPSQYRKQYQTT